MVEEHANKAFHILTFGCQMNMADSSTLAARLVESGLNQVADPSQADLIVVNTCSVRQKSEQRAIAEP
jgi:tRNA-2-methylthio-N6-dimethylallyladenosine synthase